MILRILIKLLTLTIGVFALNALCYGLYQVSPDLDNSDWCSWLSSLISGTFVLLYKYLPFSWIITIIGILSFIIYDYLRYEKANKIYSTNILKDLKEDMENIFFGLLITLFGNFFLFICLIVVQFFLLICTTLTHVFLLKYLKDWSLIFSPREFFIKTEDDIVFRIIGLLIFFYLLRLPNIIITQKKTTVSGQWLQKHPKTFLYLGLFFLPITLFWAYPILLMWFSIIPKPDKNFFYYTYSFMLAISLLVMFSRYFKKKRIIMREEIKSEILNEIKGSNSEQNKSKE